MLMTCVYKVAQSCFLKVVHFHLLVKLFAKAGEIQPSKGNHLLLGKRAFAARKIQGIKLYAVYI